MSSESVYNRNDNFSGTLTNEITPDEIETMLANEFRHYVNKEIPSCILVESVMTLAGFFSNGLGGENLWLRRESGILLPCRSSPW